MRLDLAQGVGLGRDEARPYQTIWLGPNDPVGPSFTLALWSQKGATKQALSESRASFLVAATPR